MTFQIHALPIAPFSALFGLSDAELAAQGARRVIADAPNSFPCRVSLVDATIGERLILTNFAHLDTPSSPYAGNGAIFIREEAEPAICPPGSLPALLRHRTLSVRAYDADALMREALLVPGTELEAVLERLLDDAAIAQVHLHYGGPGCYSCRVTRAS